MNPLDHLRSSFVGLDENLQHAIGFALVPVLVGDLRSQRTRSERDFKALEAPLTPSRFTPRAIGKVVSATASGEVLSVDARVRRTGSQSARDKRSDHLEKALTRTVAEASALVEQGRREGARTARQHPSDRKRGIGPVLVKRILAAFGEGQAGTLSKSLPRWPRACS